MNYFTIATVSIIIITCIKIISKNSDNDDNNNKNISPSSSPFKYNSIFIINTNDFLKINKTLKNIKNALLDYRLKDQLQIELVVFGDGISVYQKINPFESNLLELKSMGVLFVQCENTLLDRNINKNELFEFVNFVPSGNGEIILKQHQGWSSIHPY